MVLSVPVIALGAALGTATGILALCGLTCLCKYKQPGKGSPDEEQDLDTDNAKPSVLQTVQEFKVEKTAEPVQPRTVLRFPYLYGPKPAVTSSEIVNYADYTLKSSEKRSTGKAAALDEKRMNIRVNEELFIPPQNGGMKDVCVTELLSPEKAGGGKQVPELCYTLGYNQQKDALCVAFLEEQSNGCDCYILGTLVTSSGTVEAQTVLKKYQPRVIWEDALLFPVKEEELHEGMLTLTLRSCDKFSRHSIVGEIKPSLVNLGKPYGASQCEKIKTLDKKKDAGYGEVLLSISYLPAANRLLVVLIKAKNLHSKQLKELLGKDISVKVTLKHQSLKLKKKQTKRAKHKINPVWNEMIMFEVPHDLLCASSVELEMLSQDNDGQNHLLGKCSLGLHATGTERNHWEEMLRNPRRQIAMWHQLHM
uniref:Synaptotagmin 13 n=1 Tax=Salvator merianae TaxID=96440 RepID=A0A8D0DLH7_SALMN